LKHGLFYDSHDLNLDPKNRLVIPSDVRKCIVPERDGNAFFCIVGMNRKIWLYTEQVFTELAEQPLNRFPDEHDMAFNQLWYGLTSKLPWDANGRILIPEKMLKRTDTGKEITMVGCLDHLELWNRDQWQEREEELERKRGEIALRAQLTRQSPPRIA
jgi:MraZ protein